MRTYLNLWICFLASGVWHGAAWPYVAWGAYNGVFLVLDRLFLDDGLKRLPDWLANLLTLLIVMAGWTIFRSTSLSQAGALLSLMAHPGASASAPVVVPPEYVVMAVIATAICVAQRIGASIGGYDWGGLARRFSFASNGLLALLFLAAVAKGLADPFKPFIYFRF